MSTLVIHKELMRRLDQLARRTGLSPTALGNLLLEAAVTEEERLRARDQRVAKELEEVLVRAILRGEYDPAVSGTDARSGRSDPPGEALENPAAAIPPGDARRSGQPPDGNTEGSHHECRDDETESAGFPTRVVHGHDPYRADVHDDPAAP